MQAVLELMSQGKLPVEKLTSHRFPIDRAPEAYDLITSRREPFLGLLLEYAHSTEKLGDALTCELPTLDLTPSG